MFKPRYLDDQTVDAAFLTTLKLGELKALEHYLNAQVDPEVDDRALHQAAAGSLHQSLLELDAKWARLKAARRDPGDGGS